MSTNMDDLIRRRDELSNARDNLNVSSTAFQNVTIKLSGVEARIKREEERARLETTGDQDVQFDEKGKLVLRFRGHKEARTVEEWLALAERCALAEAKCPVPIALCGMPFHEIVTLIRAKRRWQQNNRVETPLRPMVIDGEPHPVFSVSEDLKTAELEGRERGHLDHIRRLEKSLEFWREKSIGQTRLQGTTAGACIVLGFGVVALAGLAVLVSGAP